MKRLIITAFITVFLVMAFLGCATERKNQSELRGLMLQDNLRMGRNKAYYSKHNLRLKKEAYRQYRKNNRNL
jgi:hypothetical protein